MANQPPLNTDQPAADLQARRLSRRALLTGGAVGAGIGALFGGAGGVAGGFALASRDVVTAETKYSGEVTRSAGDKPAAGSSSINSFGSVANAMQTSSWRCSPCERSATLARSRLFSSIRESNSRALAHRALKKRAGRSAVEIWKMLAAIASNPLVQSSRVASAAPPGPGRQSC